MLYPNKCLSAAFELICLLVLATAKQRPHIVYFLVDDLGWNDVGFHGMTEVPTPNIDALAYNGIILNNYYTYPLCSPSRSALLSGKLATSTGLQHDLIVSGQPLGLPLDLKILPQFLNDLGYESHIVGKWHLGFHKDNYFPTQRGFKSHYGFWQSNSDFFYHNSAIKFDRKDACGVPSSDTREEILMSGHCFRDGLEIVNETGKYLTDLYTNRSVEIILSHNESTPLFLYCGHHGVHRGNFSVPVRGPDNWTPLFTSLQDNPDRQNFAGAMTAIDQSLGEIVQALEQNKMLKNTLIIFSTDNGSPEFGSVAFNGGSNYPLRGGKHTIWEGGVRGVAFMWSSELTKSPFVYNGLMHIVDWLPTIYAVAGGEKNIVAEHLLDGMNLWHAITENCSSPRTSVLLQHDGNLTAYRSGDYKILSGDDVPQSNLTFPGRGPPPPGVSTTNSTVEQVLKRTFGSLVQVNGTPIEISCGAPSDEECDPMKETCLFNVVEDPCEIRNLARKQPELLQRLQSEMLSIATVVSFIPKIEYSSDPKFHGGEWTNWLDLPIPPNLTAC